MSDFLQRLRRQAKELTALERDLRATSEERIDWGQTTKSSALVGPGIPVERSFLAEYFLTTWAEWRTLYDRYPRYFGRTPESLPHHWQQTAYECEQLSNRLFQDGSLGVALALNWEEQNNGETGETRQPDDPDSSDPAVVYRSLVRNHLRLSVLAGTDAGAVAKNGTWAPCAQVAQRADAHWQAVFSQAPAVNRAAILWHLRHYRHANLGLSWLNGAMHSMLDRVLREDDAKKFNGQRSLAALNPQRDTADDVRRVVLRVCQAIAEIGYDAFVEDVTSKEFAGGDDSPLGRADALLVPGAHHARLAGIVVAVTKGEGRRGRLGFTPVMEQVKALLTERQNQIQFLLVLCDTWDSAAFRSQHFSDLLKFPWLQSLFLLVGSPDRSLSPLAIDLSLGA